MYLEAKSFPKTGTGTQPVVRQPILHSLPAEVCDYSGTCTEHELQDMCPHLTLRRSFYKPKVPEMRCEVHEGGWERGGEENQSAMSGSARHRWKTEF